MENSITAEPLLELVGRVKIPATTCRFVAKEKFVINTRDDALVKISDIDKDFIDWFLVDDGKIEELVTEREVCCHKLQQPCTDGQIIATLGGETKAENTISGVFSLIEKQRCGEKGILLNDGSTNIFYIKDVNGILRTVDVYWHGPGWFVGASLLQHEFMWGDNNQVFSPDPILKSLETLALAQA